MSGNIFILWIPRGKFYSRKIIPNVFCSVRFCWSCVVLSVRGEYTVCDDFALTATCFGWLEVQLTNVSTLCCSNARRGEERLVSCVFQETPGAKESRAARRSSSLSITLHLFRRLSSSSRGGGGNLSCGRRPCRNLITSWRRGSPAGEIEATAAATRRKWGSDAETGSSCTKERELVSLKWKHSIARSWNRPAKPDIKRSLEDTDMIRYAHRIVTWSLRNKKEPSQNIWHWVTEIWKFRSSGLN